MSQTPPGESPQDPEVQPPPAEPPPLPASPPARKNPVYSAPAPALAKDKTGQPFPVRAASYSLWLPFCSLVVGFISNSMGRGDASTVPDSTTAATKLVLGLFSTALLVSSIVLGIIALLGIRKYGTRGILGRSIAGILISGFFLTAGGLVIASMLNYPHKIENRLVGTWKEELALTAGGSVHVTLSLGADRHGGIAFETAGHTIDANGQWRVIGAPSSAAPPRLVMKFDPGHDTTLGDGVAWDIDTIQDNQISLNGKMPDGSIRKEVYQRAAP